MISQGKSFIQWASGDSEGARETQDRFSKQCPGISQARSAVHAACGDDKQAAEVQIEQAKLLENIVSSVPGAGHIAGGIAFACGDNERGCQYMKNASRSTAVVGGALVAGPVGALAVGAAYDAVQYGIETGVHGKADLGGASGIIKNMVECTDERKQGGNAFDLAACIIGDMALGKSGSQAVKNCANAMKSIASGSAPPAPGIPPSGPSALPGVPKLPSVIGALENSARMHTAAPTEANRTGSRPPNPQMDTQSQSSTSATNRTDSRPPNPQMDTQSQSSTSATTQRGTDGSAPTNNPLDTNTEEGPPREDEREFINVYDHNMEIVKQAMRENLADGDFYGESVAPVQLGYVLEELGKARPLFVKDAAPTNLSPEERSGRVEREFSSPLTQGSARCTMSDSEVGRTVCVTPTYSKTNWNPPVFCTMTADLGFMTFGYSYVARKNLMQELCSGTPPIAPESLARHRDEIRTWRAGRRDPTTMPRVHRVYSVWLDKNGEILDRIRRPRTGHISMREVQRDRASNYDEPIDQCAEHHAAVVVYELGGKPTSSLAFRIDEERRIFSVHRCDECKRYDVGTCYTDSLPMNTWLNPPRKLNVYVDP
jgi:hypothetical protein